MRQHILNIDQVKKARLAAIEYHMAHLGLGFDQRGKVMIPLGENLILPGYSRQPVWQQSVWRSDYFAPRGYCLDVPIHPDICRGRQNAARGQRGQQVSNLSVRIDSRAIVLVLEFPAV